MIQYTSSLPETLYLNELTRLCAREDDIEGESTPQYKKKMLYEHRPSEAWFPSCGILMIKENAQSVYLEFPFRHYSRLLGPYFLPLRLTGAV
jgi:hypothetical protein